MAPSTTGQAQNKSTDQTQDGLVDAVESLIIADDGVPPRSGRMLRLKTLAEVQAFLKLETVYVVKVPVKESNKILKAIDSALPPGSLTNLQHVRRFAKPEQLPSRIRQLLDPTYIKIPKKYYISPGCSVGNIPKETIAPTDKRPPQFSWLLAAPVASIGEKALVETIKQHLPKGAPEPDVHTIQVPHSAPSSMTVANKLSKKFWPTIYKSYSPYGPQPAEWRWAEKEIESNVGRYMAIAQAAAKETSDLGYGYNIGACIIDHVSGGLVSVAGDARWVISKDMKTRADAQREKGCKGSPISHAVMRVIGMVGRQRVVIDRPSALPSPSDNPNNYPFLDVAITEYEGSHHSSSPLKPGGYLCTGLDLYVTHEPCVMCCMAILHSRFERAIFAHQMPKTGALCATKEIKLPGGNNVNGSKNASVEVKEAVQPVELKEIKATGNARVAIPAKLLGKANTKGTTAVNQKENGKTSGKENSKPVGQENAKPKGKENAGANVKEITKSSNTSKDIKALVASDSETSGSNSSGVDKPEGEKGYGLFHRQELNWRMLAWLWVDEDKETWVNDVGEEVSA